MIAGTKTFTLKPPSSVHQMHLQQYDTWQEEMQEADLSFTAHRVKGAGSVLWCPVELPPTVAHQFRAGGEHGHRSDLQTDCDAAGPGDQGLMASSESERRLWSRVWHDPEPVRVTLGKGDLLYLPAMWYHYVTQEEKGADAVIAVNYWFDMVFGRQFAYHSLLQELSESAGLIETCPARSHASCV